ncbi:MAG: hypothetical protein IJP10_05415 [Clostridia bacterium]|nr:hypothetical protein [Oscillospiraceae bacterium]MBQ6797438.1 hypothetical protein [Clostridia bacterium]
MNTVSIGREDFTVLLSGIKDNDRIIRKMTGRKHPIYYKSRYTPPFERFCELRNLQLLVKDLDDINADNTIAVDLSEWIGHESDEYLTVMLKFLHDQRDHWKYIFTVGDHRREEVTKLYIKLKTYLAGHIIEDTTFTNEDGLKQYLVSECRLSGRVAGELAKLFFTKELREYRSYEMLDSVLLELRNRSGGATVTLSVLDGYLADGESLLCLLLGRKPAKEAKHENR